MDRLYATGQSGGCMMFMAVNIKYPGFLAASFLVAGQWDAAKVSPMAKANLWIVVAEGDSRAFPGMNAITDTLESEGARISRATWSGRATAAEFAQSVGKMLAEGNHVMYTVLKKGTVVPPGVPENGGSNHVCTWRIAYQIEGIRDWLFSQVKPTSRR
jgi:predicted peptidase